MLSFLKKLRHLIVLFYKVSFISFQKIVRFVFSFFKSKGLLKMNVLKTPIYYTTLQKNNNLTIVLKEQQLKYCFEKTTT